MMVTVSGIIKSVSDVHPLNVPSNSVNQFGNEADLIPVHPLNTFFPKVVTESGTKTDSRPVQDENAESPIDVIEGGIYRFVKDEQPEKAPLSIVFTLSGILISLRFLHPEKQSLPILVIPLGIFTEAIGAAFKCIFIKNSYIFRNNNFSKALAT